MYSQLHHTRSGAMINESMVSFVSRRYMRGENESPVVILSQCLHLCNLYSVYTQSRLSSVVFRILALWSLWYNPIQKTKCRNS